MLIVNCYYYMSSPQKITLNNGLRILLVPQEKNLATTVLVLVETGSKYETKEISGISHFLEHICFKGTKKRPSALTITSELDSLGAKYNAFTGHEYTGYYAKSRPENFEEILDILSDIYINQIFDPKEITKEKGVIMEEFNMYEDLPMRRVVDVFLELLYGDQPAGRKIEGIKENVQKLNKDDFVRYHNAHYVAKSSLVVVAGKFNKNEAINKIKKYFNNIKIGEKSGKEKTIENQSKPATSVKYKETDQTHIIMGVRTFDLFDKRRFALETLSDILGGGLSSRLSQKIREEMGAAYYVYSSADLFTDHGFLSVAAGIDTTKINDVISVISKEFRIMAEKPVDKKELSRAKNHLIGDLVLGLETSNQLASFYGGQEILTRKIMTPEAYIKKIKSVKTDEIMKIAKEIFQNRKLNLAIIGPFKNKDAFEKILKI